MTCNSYIQCVASTLLLSVLVFIPAACDYNLTSPCPRFFTYENNSEAEDRWYGALTLLSDYDLNGVWLRLVFDHPVGVIRSTFGEAVPRDGNEYLIRDRTFKLMGSTPHTVRFYVQQAVNATPTNFIGFRLNGRVVCPEVDFKGTTTERLFTSGDDDDHGISDKLDLTTNGTETLYTATAISNTTLTVTPTVLQVNATITTLITNATVHVIPIPDNSTNEIEPIVPEEVGTLYVSN